jgi:hypothetical protein
LLSFAGDVDVDRSLEDMESMRDIYRRSPALGEFIKSISIDALQTLSRIKGEKPADAMIQALLLTIRTCVPKFSKENTMDTTPDLRMRWFQMTMDRVAATTYAVYRFIAKHGSADKYNNLGEFLLAMLQLYPVQSLKHREMADADDGTRKQVYIATHDTCLEEIMDHALLLGLEKAEQDATLRSVLGLPYFVISRNRFHMRAELFGAVYDSALRDVVFDFSRQKKVSELSDDRKKQRALDAWNRGIEKSVDSGILDLPLLVITTAMPARVQPSAPVLPSPSSGLGIANPPPPPEDKKRKRDTVDETRVVHGTRITEAAVDESFERLETFVRDGIMAYVKNRDWTGGSNVFFTGDQAAYREHVKHHPRSSAFQKIDQIILDAMAPPSLPMTDLQKKSQTYSAFYRMYMLMTGLLDINTGVFTYQKDIPPPTVLFYTADSKDRMMEAQPHIIGELSIRKYYSAMKRGTG